MTPSLTDFTAGDVFAPISFVVTAEDVRAYRDAIGDRTATEASVPPVALAAFALGRLLEQVGLPGGSLHSGETLQFHRGVPAGSSVESRSRLSQRSVRGGWIVSVLESEIHSFGMLALSARTTVLSPVSE